MHNTVLRIGIGLVAILQLGCGAAVAGDCKVDDYGALPVEMQGGRATTVVKINGQETRFILDTGAFFSIMSRANADALKLEREPAPFGFFMSGIGGDFDVELTHIAEFGILGATLKNIEFVVGGSDMGMGLIGANLLDWKDLEIDLAQGKLHLMKPLGCEHAALAYWTQDENYEVADLSPSDRSSDRRTFVTVTINGKQMRALLDTGAPVSLLSRRAAGRAGIDLTSPQAKASRTVSGFGDKSSIKTWNVPIDSLSIGTETIQHSRLMVMDDDIGGRFDGTDMLLGADFFLAHHLFIANSQNKLYLTYNGGRVFALEMTAKTADAPGAAVPDDPDAPKTAADYALRGQARLSRGESAAAVADLDNAIRLAPDQAAYYLAHAHANLANKQTDAAIADLDKTIELDPKNVMALLFRANLRLYKKDSASAESDIAVARQLAPAGSAESELVANFYVNVNQPAAAIPLLSDWIRLHDDDSKLGAALNSRCWARGLANQELDAAFADCKGAIKRDGPLPHYLDSLGLVQLRRKNYSEAIDAYTQAVAKGSRSAKSRYGLGLAELRGGKADAGNADLEAAKALDPKIDDWFAQYGI